jgi:6-phospho-3-hexuloisomerase
MSYDEVRFLAVEELRPLLAAIDGAQVMGLVKAMDTTAGVFAAGAGRSGLAMRGFAMRLMHMGIAAHVIGDATTPALRAGDLLVIGSGSGATPSLVSMAAKAKSLGGRLALVTADGGSPIARSADAVVLLPAPSPKKGAGAGGGAAPGEPVITSRQPMATLFEQCLGILLDSVIMLLMDTRGMSSGQMFTRHANLE